MLGRRNKVGRREADSPTHTSREEARTVAQCSEQARERHVRVSGGAGGRGGGLLNPGTTTPVETAWHRKVHATPLQVMLRGRGPGNQPGHRGRGHGAIGERVDLRPHRLRKQLPVVCISCRRHAKSPQNFDGATQPASLCLRKQLGHYIHTTRARTYTARESVHSPPRADCWREALPSCCHRLSCRPVRSRFRGPRRHSSRALAI